jgi:hypothetical protein
MLYWYESLEYASRVLDWSRLCYAEKVKNFVASGMLIGIKGVRKGTSLPTERGWLDDHFQREKA